MELFDVYPLYDVRPEKAKGLVVIDEQGQEYMDYYGGHAVISIGHGHPHYVARLKAQLDKIGFYSNAVQNPLQVALAERLGRASGCESYQLFLCNSGAEANENALKMASFQTGRHRVIAFNNAFHGRTSAAVATTDNPAIHAPLNQQQDVVFLPFNDLEAFEKEITKNDVCAVIIEAIQGVGGLDEPSTEFYQNIAKACKTHGTVLIADEVQSGFGRSGKFFAFQHHKIQPDIISMAKGMGNGFPVGGILIHESIRPKYGMLGTTFGGNHLACTAVLAVLDVVEKEGLQANAAAMGDYFMERAKDIPQVKKVKGRGLMLGLEFAIPVAQLRKDLIYHQKVFTGGAKNKNLIRFLPPLTINKAEIDHFFKCLKNELS